MSPRSPLLACCLLAACATPATRDEDAGPRTRGLECDAPLTVRLTPSTTPPNTGLPVAAVAWADEHCELGTDETREDALLVVADFTGTVFGAAGLSLNAVRNWNIVGSSLGGAPATYLAGVPRATDVTLVLEEPRTRERATVTLRVDGDVVALLDMGLAP